jgi:membrane protease YdiL (CAAX protease family)
MTEGSPAERFDNAPPAATRPAGSDTPEQHSIGRSVVLHLLPGALITLFFALTAPVARGLGFPSLLAIFLAIPFVLIPFELGYLLREARRCNGRISLEGVVVYREPIPLWQFVLLVIGLFLWSGVAFGLIGLLDPLLVEALFRWLPDWFFLNEDLSAYPRPVLLGIWALGLVGNGIAAPVVEELYFRGHLLPRISRFGGWAPLINTVLFSLYHFFTPWQLLGRILALLPMVYAVWWRRNIYIGIAVHCMGNTVTMIALLLTILG